VMQVLFSFKRADLPIFPGQLMDVYIEDRADRAAEPAASEPPGKKQ
jgi:hypothetical protein